MMRYAPRRLVILPLALVLAVVVFVLLPVVGAVQAIVALGVVVGRRPRWRALPLRRELHMVWWNEPRPDLASEQECSRWLNHTWVNIDAWIQEQGDMTELTPDSSP
jgi:hypothetical protein